MVIYRRFLLFLHLDVKAIVLGKLFLRELFPVTDTSLSALVASSPFLSLTLLTYKESHPTIWFPLPFAHFQPTGFSMFLNGL